MGGTAAPPPVAAGTTPAAATATPAPVVVAEATVQRLPERLQDVTRPMVLTGTSAGETPDGLTRVRTSAGEVLLKLPAPLPADRPVTLQITPAQTLLGQAATGQMATGEEAAGRTPAGQALQTPQPMPTAPPPMTGGQTVPARALVLMQPPTTAPAASAPSASAPAGMAAAASPQSNAGPAPSVILPNPSAVPPPAVAALPLLMPGTIVPALVLAAVPKAPVLAGASVPSGHATPPQAQPGQPPVAEPPADTPAGTAAGTVTAPAAQRPATQPPVSQPATAAAPSPAGRPTLDAPVQLGGNAAHPGAETPTLKPPPVPTAPDLPQGGTVALKILTVTLPSTEPASARPPMAGAPPPPAKPAPAPPPGMGGPPDPIPGPMPGPMPGPVPDAASDAADAPLIRGTVAGSTPQGQPILATRQGMLALNVQASLPQGAKVTAALTDPAKAIQGAPPPPAEPAPMTERDWPAMRQLLATLAGMDRALAHTVLSSIMPQPNRKLGAALTFLLSAIRGGDARGWLGEETAAALEKGGHGDLLSQLDREFKTLQKQANEPLPGDWRPYTLPMMDANGPNPIQLHIHPIDPEQEGEQKAGGGPKGSRFLIDVTLSRLGPMQLDGLVQPNRFDLILRSHTALSPELRLELIQIFADSVRSVGYTGGLSFQSGAKCWVKLTRAGGGRNVTA